jgi:hypothetical protein
MRRILIILLLTIGFMSCMADEKIIVTKKIVERNGTGFIEKTVEETFPLSTEQLSLSIPVMGTSVVKIEGVEKLTNVKRLLLGYDLQDFSFLEKLVNVEILILKYLDKPIDLDFIKKMPKLKIVYVEDIVMIKEELDFQNNQELEFISLSNIRSKNRNGPFKLTMNNMPKTIRYIDLHLAALIIKDEIFFNSLQNVFCVIIHNDIHFPTFKVDEEYLKTHQNIKIGNPDKILPVKYQREQVYGLFGLQ